MSTTAASSTRSSSPATSTSDSLSDEQSAFQPSVDFSAWCHSFSPEDDAASWDVQDPSLSKADDSSMLMLDECAPDHVYEPISPQSPIAINPAVFQLPNTQREKKPSSAMSLFSNFSSDNSSSESSPMVDLIPKTTTTLAIATKVEPPPPAQPRKVDTTGTHRVIFPAKESCYNLAILTPSIPPSGTKSRVETQVRVALDLALASGSSGDPLNYDRIGSWKWLKLPKGTATRKRSRKEGKIDASPMDTLYLDADVVCSSNPSKLVTSCTTCQGREAKRVARKIAARVRPSRSDSDSNDGPSEGFKATNVIQFNCPDTLDFSSGSVVLPLRITCYCRHHREKVGFNVRFAMKDDSGRIIGSGISPPIMITDDHKSTDKGAPKPQASVAPYATAEPEWNPRHPIGLPVSSVAAELAPVSSPIESSLTSRRRHSGAKEGAVARKRAKPYDAGRPSSNRAKRAESTEGNPYPNVAPAPSPSSACNPYPDLSGFEHISSASTSVYNSTAPPSPATMGRDIISALPSPPHSFGSPISPQSSFFEHDAFMREALAQTSSFLPLSPPNTAPSSPPVNEVLPSGLGEPRVDLASFTYALFQPQQEPPNPVLSARPKIHRLIPSTGPTYGGIEVTVLGSNFHSSVIFNCVFGGVIASSTQRWSDNTLVCILPPRVTPGVVPVTLENIKLDNDPVTEPVLFTYTDETDRTLMELALQVVGLKMTGKIEDAKDIAMRIVGNSSSEQSSQGTSMDVSQMLSLATSALPDSRSLLLGRTNDAEFEKIIMDSLSALDLGVGETAHKVISHATKTGQTLLHLACFLNFPSLVEFLIHREIDLDARDINGCTALHFAALSKSQCCARLVINAGADVNIADDLGRTPIELVSEGFYGPLLTHTSYSSGGSQSSDSDEESNFGDVEEDSEAESRIPSRPHSRAHVRRRLRHSRSRRSSKPASVVSDASDVEEPFDYDAAADDDDNATVVSPESLSMPDGPGKEASLDEKQAASFAAFLQRAWTQFQAPHLMPQMPQMPQLPGVPAWVFPVFVPMQAWPPFRSEKREETAEGKGKVLDGEDAAKTNEWSAMWTQMAAAMARQSQLASEVVDKASLQAQNLEAKEDSKRASVGPVELPAAELAIATAPTSSRSILRRFRSKQTPTHVSEKEVKAYTYRPVKTKAAAKAAKKEDRMLVIFWIPILLVAIAWALYSTFPIVLSFVKHYVPLDSITN